MPKVGMQPIRRQQLIEATMAAVNEVGMHEASIAQIAKRAGVSNGIISHYFRDKNGLLEATMRYLIRHLGEAVKQHLAVLSVNDPRARLRAIAEGNFDDSQINSAAMKTWLAFWASSMHSPQLYRLQQVNNRRLYSNLCAEFKRCLPREQAQLAAKGMAGLIDGLWLRSALSGEHFNRQEALLIIHNYIEQQLNIKYKC
ncbi:transcriptional regulator BetI [Yersinia pseudotuberculosis]|nr:transcriptional regulator BetI [Yersinia pseudotuberculosis]AJJ57548.1 transcriptional repressor BetI [Yersinia pseudotuberculosis YPIII]AYW88807.1 transcriptional regulator BetI [Yersinia pseudotuberculosis]AYW99555.1 transcriptional regulator BetI [Yersinia pseudotuberculosis]AZA31117.1 transcriptional regulator BetI [Yersinia pseudotuberculosis]MBK1424084.1 transcriptional regulator BetI [Yersinia pseudotuberculosis]